MTAVSISLTPPARAEEVPREEAARALAHVRSGQEIDVPTAAALLGARGETLGQLLELAGSLRDAGAAARGDAEGRTITYSRKVFIPLTTLCQDRCHYCVFVDTPGGLRAQGKQPYLGPEDVLEIAREGAEMGCKEALFTLGDRPEDRWEAAAEWLAAHGYASTLDYVGAMAEMVLRETGLLPHLNPGVMTWPEMQRLRRISPSMGMMLETTSRALWAERGGAHYGSPDKDPALRLQVIDDAGRSRIPFTTGILLGIGETLTDRAESLFALRDAHARWGHVQEVIVQNFRAKPRTAMQNEPDLATDQYVAAVAVARLVMGADAHIQAPPNLTDPAELNLLIRAGIDDWGGISPLTPDHVNPERPWPHLDDLARLTAEAGYTLRERLTAHPRWALDPEYWLDPALHGPTAALRDEHGRAEQRALPSPGAATAPDAERSPGSPQARSLENPLLASGERRLLRRAEADPAGLSDAEYAALLEYDGDALEELSTLADAVRRERVGDVLTYAVNRNVNSSLYSPQRTARRQNSPRHITGGLDDAGLRAVAAEAAAAGATEICLQGPLDQELPGEAYFDLLDALRAEHPQLHLHAYRPAEVQDAASRLGTTPAGVHRRMREHGVRSVPGTAARILDDSIRKTLSGGSDMPAGQWLELIRTAHREGLRSTATIVYGHIESPADVVSHFRKLAALQEETGGFTELIPMPLVPQDSPVPVPGVTRLASRRYSRALHAVARLMLDGRIDHIQAAWTKLGLSGAEEVLRGGADDIGGILLDGAAHPETDPESGRSLTLRDVRRIAGGLGRTSQQRSTVYELLSADRASGPGAPAEASPASASLTGTALAGTALAKASP